MRLAPAPIRLLASLAMWLAGGCGGDDSSPASLTGIWKGQVASEPGPVEASFVLIEDPRHAVDGTALFVGYFPEPEVASFVVTGSRSVTTVGFTLDDLVSRHPDFYEGELIDSRHITGHLSGNFYDGESLDLEREE